MKTLTDLKFSIAHAQTLRESLQYLLDRPSDGVLRIISDKANGLVALKGATILGATITTTKQTGINALNKLLRVETGLFQFMELAPNKSAMSAQELNVSLRELLDRETLAPDDGVPMTDDEIFEMLNSEESLTGQQIELLDKYKDLTEVEREEFAKEHPGFRKMMEQRGLSAEQLRWLSVFQNLTSEQDRKAFVQENPVFVNSMHESPMLLKRQHDLKKAREEFANKEVGRFADLAQKNRWTEQQMEALRRTYQSVASDRERQAFLAEHPDFAEVMSEAGLTLEQAEELRKAKLASANEDVAAFMLFQQRLLGPDHPPLSEDQIDMLTRLYVDLADAKNKQEFLETNPLLSEDIPYVRTFDPAELDQIGAESEEPEKQRELSDLVRDIITPIDMDPGIASSEQKVEFTALPVTRTYVNLKRVKREKVSNTVSWAALFVVGGSTLFLFMAFLNRGSPQANFGVVPPDEKDIIKEEVHSAVQAAVPMVRGGEVNPRPPANSSSTYGKYFNDQALENMRHTEQQIATISRMVAEGKTLQAIAACEELLAMDPDSVEARIQLIKLYTARGDFLKARALCISGIKRARTPQDREMFVVLLKAVLLDRR